MNKKHFYFTKDYNLNKYHIKCNKTGGDRVYKDVLRRQRRRRIFFGHEH